MWFGLGWLFEKSNRTVHKVIFQKYLGAGRFEQVRVNYCGSTEKVIRFGGKEYPFDASDWCDMKGHIFIHYKDYNQLINYGKYADEKGYELAVKYSKFPKSVVYSVPAAKIISPEEHDSVRVSKDLKSVFSGGGMYGLAVILLALGGGVGVGLFIGSYVLPLVTKAAGA